ncbi:hypothetical protein V513_09550 [Mesotoga sp. H07.pep.5.3]|nr:hypothetical protein V513_09550 [Mesotoga sp. H07.pep.5.3]
MSSQTCFEINSKNEEPGRVASERGTAILDGDGGPLTDNVVFISVQRVLSSVKRLFSANQFLLLFLLLTTDVKPR